MKAVSDNFITKTKATAKQINTKVFFAWEKEIADDRKFIVLDDSELDSDDILWNGNQETIAFSDRYRYTDETANLKSWSVSQKVSNYPWGVIQGTASIELNNASGKYFLSRPEGADLAIEGSRSLNGFNGYAISGSTLSAASSADASYTMVLNVEGGKTYIIRKRYQGTSNRLRVGLSASALISGGNLSCTVDRDGYETATVATGATDEWMYINYATSNVLAVEAIESLSVKTVENNPYSNLPNRPVKIQTEIDGESVNLFMGYSSRPEISIVNSTYKIKAYDAIAFLSTITSNLSIITNQPLHAIIKSLLIEAGFTESQFVLENGVQDSIDFVNPKGRNVANLLNELCASEQYLMFADGDGIIHGWNVNHYDVSENGTDWRANFNNASEMVWGSSSVINDVVVKASPYKIMPTGLFFEMSDPTDDYLVPANETVNIFVEFQDADSNAIYAIDFNAPTYNSANDSSYLTNVEKDGSGADNHTAITLTSFANLGDTARFTFANSSSTPTYITQITLIGESAQKVKIVSTESIDSDSIEKYGRNPDGEEGSALVLESDYVQDAAFATRLAERLTRLYSEPMYKVESPIFFAPQLEIGDQILADVGGFGEKNTLLFGYDLSGNANGNYRQRLFLEERPLENFFKLDYSKLDSNSTLAF